MDVTRKKKTEKTSLVENPQFSDKGNFTSTNTVHPQILFNSYPRFLQDKVKENGNE